MIPAGGAVIRETCNDRSEPGRQSISMPRTSLLEICLDRQTCLPVAELERFARVASYEEPACRAYVEAGP